MAFIVLKNDLKSTFKGPKVLFYLALIYLLTSGYKPLDKVHEVSDS